MSSGAFLGGRGSSELAALENGQMKIADDIAQLTSIVLTVQGDIARLLAVARPNNAPVTLLNEHEEQQAEQPGGPLPPPTPPTECTPPPPGPSLWQHSASSTQPEPRSSEVAEPRHSEAASLVAQEVGAGTEQADDWPANIALREGLEIPRSSEADRTRALARSISRCPAGTSEASGGFDHVYASPDHERGATGRIRCLMVKPTSGTRTLFDAVGIVVLGYDVIVMPYVLAWDIAFEGWLMIASWSTCVFWTVDILLTFMTGIYENGKVELGARKVALKYFRTWLIPDVCMASCDWASMIIARIAQNDSGASGLKLARFAKIGRLLRIPAMLRAVKFFTFVEEYVDSHVTAGHKAALQVYVLACGTLLANHWIACGWMAVGLMLPSDTGHSWVETALLVNGQTVQFMEADRLYQYTTALHWGIAQFTLGAIEISCSNSWERIFNMACIFVGLLFGSTLVSLLSAAMVDARMTERTSKLRRVRLFLSENKLSRQVATQVRQQVVERLDQKERLTEQDIPALQLLSTQLRRELRCDMFKQHLLTFRLFRLWNSLDPRLFQVLCDSAVSYRFLSENDELFATGSVADSAYYVVSGTLQYYADQSTRVCKGAWLCEAALWTVWIHRGQLEASTFAQLVAISADSLVKVLHLRDTVPHRRGVEDITKDYARCYHSRVATAMEPTDVEVPCTSWEEIVLGMGSAQQTQMSLLALKRLGEERSGFAKLWRRGRHDVRLLREEVLQGKSSLLINDSGEVERVVPLVILRVERSCDRGTQVLVQLGKLPPDGRVKPSCRLPGLKPEPGEGPREAMDRLLHRRLEPFSGKVKVEDVRREDQQKPSPKFELKTKYLRTVWTLSMTGDIDTRSFNTPSFASPPPMCKSNGGNAWFTGIGRFIGTGRTPPSQPQQSARSRGQQVASSNIEWEVFLTLDHRDATQVWYAWLTKQEFEYLSSVHMDGLSEWLEALVWVDAQSQQEHLKPWGCIETI